MLIPMLICLEADPHHYHEIDAPLLNIGHNARKCQGRDRAINDAIDSKHHRSRSKPCQHCPLPQTLYAHTYVAIHTIPNLHPRMRSTQYTATSTIPATDTYSTKPTLPQRRPAYSTTPFRPVQRILTYIEPSRRSPQKLLAHPTTTATVATQASIPSCGLETALQGER